ncbi:C25 family cysteine peptidase [Planctomycetota bacterium]|nr:C25 family cysteine peptidase [Planctomycetota bacterium]
MSNLVKRLPTSAFVLCFIVAVSIANKDSDSFAQPEQKSPAADTIATNANANWPATVLLITNDALAKSWKPFAEHKTKLGKRTEIVTVEAIKKAYEGDDIQHSIKACINEFVENRETLWVILGGDSTADGGIVPDRDTVHTRMEHEDIPTDLWYVSETDWDANGDGKFGDWMKDRKDISYTTRAAIGRIPVRKADEVKNFTAKVVKYECAFPNTKFATEFIVTCTEERGYDRVDDMWEIINEKWDGSLNKFFTDSTPWDGKKKGDFDLSPDNVCKKIDEHAASKWHLIGHGNPGAWIVEGGPITATRAGELKNKTPILVTTVSCHTGRFDGEKDPCPAEGMLRGKGGAVLVIAPARPGLAAPSVAGEDLNDAKIDGLNLLYTRFWQHGLDGSGLTVGEAFAKAREEVAPSTKAKRGIKDHFTLCEVNLLGDPTLGFHAKAPVPVKIGGQREIKADAKFLKVTTGTANTSVCFWQEGTCYATAKADEKGRFKVPVSNLKKGQAWVTVTGPNANAVIREITVK